MNLNKSGKLGEIKQNMKARLRINFDELEPLTQSYVSDKLAMMNKTDRVLHHTYG